jgi:endonuclease/exonuclease/phosphatase family metal-dependent hydrolase
MKNRKSIGNGKTGRGVWFAGPAAAALIGLMGCGAVPGSGAPQSLKIVTWNVQALFDGEDTGTEYDDYLTAAGWSGEKYRARLTALAESVEYMAKGVPDVLALQEVENAEVLKELAGGPLAKHGYQWVFFADNPGAALGVGVLSRLPLVETRAHSVTAGGHTSPRPVAEVWLRPGNETLALFVCHWKSKLGGADATEAERRASAAVIARRIREIRAEKPDMPVLVAGDLNENHDEFYRLSGADVSALLPDDPPAAGLAAVRKDYLVISGEKPPRARHFAGETAALYSPWGNEMEAGSYYYRNTWETIDHFLLSGGFFDGKGWDFDTCEVLNKEPFINDRGTPRTYNPRTGNGLSDHLPLLLTLKRPEPL